MWGFGGGGSMDGGGGEGGHLATMDKVEEGTILVVLWAVSRGRWRDNKDVPHPWERACRPPATSKPHWVNLQFHYISRVKPVWSFQAANTALWWLGGDNTADLSYTGRE